MKYAIRNAAGSLELRQDSLSVLPDGGRLLTDAEYDQLLTGTFDLVGDTIVPMTETAEQVAVRNAGQKAAMLVRAFELRDKALSRLSVLAGMAARAGDTATTAACDTAATSLMGITGIASVVAATDGASTQYALTVAWLSTAATLRAAAPSTADLFVGLGL